MKNNRLIPTIIQDSLSKEVVMLGYMNTKSLEKTRKTRTVWFWSRKRQKLWMKGESSGNTLVVKNIYEDCDADTLLILVTLVGKTVCHTGNYSCFFTKIL